MALSDNTLGAGAARSGMTSPGRSDECSGCGFRATCDYEGRDGVLYPFCEECFWRFKEQEEVELYLEAWVEEEPEEPCEDCQECDATTRFVHLTKGEFFLCDACFAAADHEDDYLEFCTCVYPHHEKKGDVIRCAECMRSIKAPMHCQCPVFATDPDKPNHCVLCWGLVVLLSQEEGDRRWR